MAEISVIVPIYKVQPYLDMCVHSITSQKFQDIGIILVDDGSPDLCPKICDEWAKRDCRIRVIHKQNQGLGLARNSGLQVADTRYVSFVDADDWIDPQMYQTLIEDIEREKADVVYCGTKYVQGKSINTVAPPEKKNYEKAEIATDFVPQIIGPLPESWRGTFAGVSCCGTLYSRDLLIKNRIAFPSERDGCISEDVAFNLAVCHAANKIVIDPHSYYFYCLREQESLTSTYRKDRFARNKEMYEFLRKEAQAFGIEQTSQVKLRLNTTFLNSLVAVGKTTVAAEQAGILSHAEALKALANMCSDTLVTQVLKDYPLNTVPIKKRLFWLALREKQAGTLWLLAKLRNRK